MKAALVIAIPLTVIAIVLVAMLVRSRGDSILADCKRQAESQYGGRLDNYNSLMYEAASRDCERQAVFWRLKSAP